MQLFRLVNPNVFEDAPEIAMDMHFAIQWSTERFFIVIGCRVAIFMPNPDNFRPYTNYLSQRWLARGLTNAQRAESFTGWLADLPPGPADIQPIPPGGAPGAPPTPPGLRPFPIGALPPTPSRPSAIYGHLPFTARTDSQTLIYRWESFPTSRRILRVGNGGTIANDTYASPASEVPFAVTGFAAVARFALPSLLPACFRWELQPDPCDLECGSSVPLYGQSGGGVEVKFTALTANRCPIADPVVLPAL